MKYRFRDASGDADADLDATWWRVARALAAPERDPELWAGRFHEALSGFKFLPAGRVIAGAGTGRSVTLFNCFVMGAIPDDMSGIFENLREAALTMQQGGGIGHDFSTLRPQGAPVMGVGADASGPLSFMDVWDCDVPHHHERGLAPRRHDGDACAAIIPTSRPSSTPSAIPGGCACSTSRCWSPTPS